MEEQSNDDDYSSIVEILVGMFGEVLSKDAIVTIVESCGGDLEESANIIMNITTESDDSSTKVNSLQVTNINLITSIDQSKLADTKDNNNSSNTQASQNTAADQVIPQQDALVYRQALLSHVSASTSGALPKQIPKKPITSIGEPKELKQILKYHAKGIRTLILMRGPPGSGKSYLARNVVDKIYDSHVPDFWSTHILSTDDYFLRGGIYYYDRSRIADAHKWNQRRSYLAMSKGVSPVIIDNTNIEIWEMEPYVREGIKNGYVIILLEPNTPWAWKVNQLLRKNTHNVPAYSIERMVNNYQRITVNELLQMLGISDRMNRTPPQLRLIPEFTPNTALSPSELQSDGRSCKIENQDHNKDKIEEKMQHLQFGSNLSDNVTKENKEEETTIEVTVEATGLEENMAIYEEVQKHLEEVAKIENEWDNGENWDSNSDKEHLNKVIEPTQNVLPQRKVRSAETPTSKNLLTSIGDIQDWTIFMPTWNEINPSITEHSSTLPIEKVSSSTCMEIGDTDLSSLKNPLKIITATPRDINEFFISDKNEKIPEKWMLDKSTSTNNDTMMPTGRCQNEERHFNEFRKLFKYIARADLRDIFDKCNGDVNWAVDIVLSDMSHKELHTKDENDLLELEIDDGNYDNDQCECIAAYNIIPDQNTSFPKKIKNEAAMEIISSPLHEKRKIKKDNPLSDEIIQLKQKIEQNIVISDDHYSTHCLKIRKLRRGELDETTEHTAKVSEESSESDPNEQNLPSTSNVISEDVSDIETISTVDDVEKTISIDVCKDLMSQLDEHFGWKDMMFSKNISTTINVPVSILNELNALWIESLLYQLEKNGRQLEIMVKQDEELARQMAQKEAELVQSGNEPGMPDFKEIMDMDYALSLYQKDVAQWRNNEPNDLAAKMTKDKLKNIFPELSEESLSEILMAHDNNFKATVESLLVSTGRGDVLLINNGISKFIMEKETEQREKLIQEENVALSEAEWPSLAESETIDMDLVNKYRQDAEKHLRVRNMTHQKAQDLMRRGMIPAASFYSEMANYHKMKYEQSNSYAAASLMHLHANNAKTRDTVDLHYLHVNEAKESLDLFLDEHIRILRNGNGPEYQKLFFITGRGLHSNGKPRIKPAVQKRLTERGVAHAESNPGLLNAKIKADDYLSTELE